MPPTLHNGRIAEGRALPHENRRHSEWDDHSEAYPYGWDGPHLRFSLEFPKGEFFLSLYNFNKDGLERGNRFRDYPIHLRAVGHGRTEGAGSPDGAVLSRGRFHDFRGGVWKRWFVAGPCSLTVEIRRNDSWSTTVAAVAVDTADPLPEPYFPPHAGADLLAGTPDAADVRRMDPVSGRLFGAARPLSPGEAHRHCAALRFWAGSRGRAPGAVDAGVDAADGYARSLLLYWTASFPGYEATLRALGLVPPRDIELAIRRAGGDGDTGRGREAVLEYVHETSVNRPAAWKKKYTRPYGRSASR